MALYGTTNVSHGTPALQNISSSYKTGLNLTAATATLRRAFIYEFGVGASAVPNATDCEIVWNMARCTSIGTGVTPSSAG